MVRLLFDHGADIDAPSSDDSRALALTAKEVYLDIVRLLLDRGARIDAPSGSFGTALQEASAGASLATVQPVPNRGADLNALHAISKAASPSLMFKS
jgi:ankyrin repeat protein